MLMGITSPAGENVKEPDLMHWKVGKCKCAAMRSSLGT